MQNILLKIAKNIQVFFNIVSLNMFRRKQISKVRQVFPIKHKINESNVNYQRIVLYCTLCILKEFAIKFWLPAKICYFIFLTGITTPWVPAISYSSRFMIYSSFFVVAKLFLEYFFRENISWILNWYSSWWYLWTLKKGNVWEVASKTFTCSLCSLTSSKYIFPS